jgi:hypothetical protein
MKKIKSLIIIFLLFSYSLNAQLHYLSSTSGGACYEVCYYNNYLYAGCANTLKVFDLSGSNQTPGNLTFEKRFISNIDQIQVHNGFLYVCANHDGLWKFDLSQNAAEPIFIAQYESESIDESVYDIAFYGDSIVLAAKTKLNLLLDSANNFSYIKSIVSFSGTTRIRGIDIKDDYLAYTVAYSSSNSQDGVYLFNLKNMQQLDFYNDSQADPMEVYFGQNTNLLHVMGGTFASWPFTDGSYYALDYSTPVSMQVKYSDTISGMLLLGSIAAAMSATIINDTVYIATQGGGPIGYTFLSPYSGQVYVYDASNANNIELLTDIYAGLYHFDTDINETTRKMYVASEWYGILTIDISDIYNETDLGMTLTGGWCHGSDFAKNRLVEANEGYGIRLFDVSKMQLPKLIAEDTSGGFCRAISISDSADYVYGWFLTGDRLRVRAGVDLSVIADTTFDSGTLIISDFQKSRYHNGKIAVIEEISIASKKIVVGNVSNAHQPYVQFLRQKNNINDLLFHSSGLLFACADDSIIVFDPSNMNIITSVSPPLGGFLQPYRAFTMYDDTLYVYYAGLGEGIAKYFYDSSLQTLTYISASVYDMNSGDRVFMASDDSFLYIASTLDSLKAIEKWPPHQEVANYNHGADFIYDNLWGIMDLYFKNDYLILNEYMGQSSIFGQPTPTGIHLSDASDTQILVFPNPASDFITIYTGIHNEYLIQIYNVMGEITYSADFNDDKIRINTQNLSKGLYFISMKTDAKEYVISLIK